MPRRPLDFLVLILLFLSHDVSEHNELLPLHDFDFYNNLIISSRSGYPTDCVRNVFRIRIRNWVRNKLGRNDQDPKCLCTDAELIDPNTNFRYNFPTRIFPQV